MEHTCNGKAKPSCKACWADVDDAQTPATGTTIINAPNSKGTVVKTSHGEVWHL